MKKKLLCIIIAGFLFFCVPVKGYSASLAPLTFGMSEEVVLAFLASLLGLSARETFDSYTDLTEYANDLRLGFTEYIAGSATALEIAKWIQDVAVGNIDKSSVIWEKFYAYCTSQYLDVAINGGVPVDTTIDGSSLSFEYFPVMTFERYGSTEIQKRYYNNAISINGSHEHDILYCSDTNVGGYYTIENVSSGVVTTNELTCPNTYVHNNKTVYYDTSYLSSSFSGSYTEYTIASKDYGKAAWSVIYGGFEAPSANIGVLSGAFNSVLDTSSIDNIIDGTSVLQLYNPAAAQNGLQIVPDPEDPQDIVIPAMLTADWYNFLKQFGPSGAAQFVAAYNALNAVQGVSTGAIDGIYNNLGIASAISTAAQAAQGTLTLADNNVFPQASTIADAINGVIPGALTPQVPDNGIDNESDQGLYKLPDLKDFFPFCIPFDLIDLLSCFIAEPETPQFVIALSTGEDTVTGQMDLHIWDNIASVLRGLELIAFTVGLIMITRNIIRG